MVRYYIICEGRVQGVGFRFFCQMFIRNIKKGNFFIRVNNLSQKKIDLKPSEKKFVIR